MVGPLPVALRFNFKRPALLPCLAVLFFFYFLAVADAPDTLKKWGLV